MAKRSRENEEALEQNTHLIRVREFVLCSVGVDLEGSG